MLKRCYAIELRGRAVLLGTAAMVSGRSSRDAKSWHPLRGIAARRISPMRTLIWTGKERWNWEFYALLIFLVDGFKLYREYPAEL